MSDFKKEVELHLMSFLQGNGFSFERQSVDVETGETCIFYVSESCRLKIVRSGRDGEVNCLLAGNQNSQSHISKIEWKYYRSLIPRAGEQTIEDLLAAIPDKPRGCDEQLESIRKDLERHFSKIRHELCEGD